ncbi:ATP-binding cassette domain-containing protein [Pseudooceanicola sp. CBS1P-1]|uniref:ATP-binding cassette domain-containing protein n=1 Tax=Pseudooceanicola albus TaxID=2692189 RepID=A0A6L7G5C9_9RHOB|nr:MULTISPECIES: ATP-binding cassette domain-containing protein [Pseudooceanicola]MBT9386015.1 ATP-binding cassette domain-containing protein [Pseudooceanicola endophyticus]MXN19564.1 ATP-binding cassette domain-containing protein [Pseudooceanicola albus]
MTPSDTSGRGRAPALLMRDIDKAFDGHPALTGAGFRLEYGHVHALVGENGAGKSTIMNVATAVYAADAGEVIVDGYGTALRTPAEALSAGLGMVHQHFRLVGRFTVAENVALALGGAGQPCSLSEAARRVREKAAELDFRLDPHARVERLSIAEQQRAEVLRVLLLGARILILDEPTAVLTAAEARALLALVRRLADEGRAVALVTHKLHEVAGYCDRVTIMRQGRTVLAAAEVAGADLNDFARLAVGELPDTPRPAPVTPGAPLLEIENLSVRRGDGSAAVEGLSLSLRAGEILGIAGVGGNGQPELVDCLSGLSPAVAGTVRLAGQEATRAPVRRRRRAGLAVIPADRSDSALIGGLPLAQNLALTGVWRGAFGPFWWLNKARMRRAAETAITERDIRGGGVATPAGLLSGGNAQKLLLARELGPGARVIVAHSPSRGLDLRATRAVHDALRQAVREGAACLLISEDLEEIMTLSNRIAVMNHGRLSAPMPVAEASAQALGALMAGHA